MKKTIIPLLIIIIILTGCTNIIPIKKNITTTIYNSTTYNITNNITNNITTNISGNMSQLNYDIQKNITNTLENGSYYNISINNSAQRYIAHNTKDCYGYNCSAWIMFNATNQSLIIKVT